MNSSIPDILARIVEYKKADLASAMVQRGELEVLGEETRPGRRDFRAALAAGDVAIIAEIKKASPSKGVLATAFDPAAIARAYERGGAAALVGPHRRAVLSRAVWTIWPARARRSRFRCCARISPSTSTRSSKRPRTRRRHPADRRDPDRRDGCAQLREHGRAIRHGRAGRGARRDRTRTRPSTPGADLIGVNNRNLRDVRSDARDLAAPG